MASEQVRRPNRLHLPPFTGDSVAQKAIWSLAAQADRRSEKLDKAVELLIPYLQDKQFLLLAGALKR
jgi:hypothetical protein